MASVSARGSMSVGTRLEVGASPTNYSLIHQGQLDRSCLGSYMCAVIHPLIRYQDDAGVEYLPSAAAVTGGYPPDAIIPAGLEATGPWSLFPILFPIYLIRHFLQDSDAVEVLHGLQAQQAAWQRMERHGNFIPLW